MYDPMTVAFEIRCLGVTIWHVDPEKRGDDDSCDWFGRKVEPTPAEEEVQNALADMATLLDNRPHFPDSPEHQRFQALKKALFQARRKKGWRIHPRWHVWHWSIQVAFVQKLKRRLFSRCIRCGKRFPWGYCPVGTWSSRGPRWFRNEECWHHDCEQPESNGACSTGGSR